MRMLNQLSMLLDRKLMETRNNRTVGIRDRLTNAATRRVRSFEPTTPRRRSKISLTRFRTIRKISRMIRMILMLMRPKMRTLLEIGRIVSCLVRWVSRKVSRTTRMTVTTMRIRSRFRRRSSLLSKRGAERSRFKRPPPCGTSPSRNPRGRQKRTHIPYIGEAGPCRVWP